MKKIAFKIMGLALWGLLIYYIVATLMYHDALLNPFRNM
jgi:hypothetical protein